MSQKSKEQENLVITEKVGTVHGTVDASFVTEYEDHCREFLREFQDFLALWEDKIHIVSRNFRSYDHRKYEEVFLRGGSAEPSESSRAIPMPPFTAGER